MSKEKLEIGDYVKQLGYDGTPFYALITSFDDDGDYNVVDQDGDSSIWFSRDNIEYVEASEVNSMYIMIPLVTSEEGYSGAIDFKNKVLHVGCQEVPFSMLETIYNHIKHTLANEPNAAAVDA